MQLQAHPQLKATQYLCGPTFPQNISFRNLLCPQVFKLARVLLRSFNFAKQKTSSWLSFQLFLHRGQVDLWSEPFLRCRKGIFFHYFRSFTFCTSFMIFSHLNSKRFWTAFSYRTFFTVCFCIGVQMSGKCSITWFITRFCRRKSQIQKKFHNLRTAHVIKTKAINAVHIQKSTCLTGWFVSTFDKSRIFQSI